MPTSRSRWEVTGHMYRIHAYFKVMVGGLRSHLNDSCLLQGQDGSSKVICTGFMPHSKVKVGDQRSHVGGRPCEWSRTVLECSKIILEFSRTMF